MINTNKINLIRAAKNKHVNVVNDVNGLKADASNNDIKKSIAAISNIKSQQASEAIAKLSNTYANSDTDLNTTLKDYTKIPVSNYYDANKNYATTAYNNVANSPTNFQQNSSGVAKVATNGYENLSTTTLQSMSEISGTKNKLQTLNQNNANIINSVANNYDVNNLPSNFSSYANSKVSQCSVEFPNAVSSVQNTFNSGIASATSINVFSQNNVASNLVGICNKNLGTTSILNDTVANSISSLGGGLGGNISNVSNGLLQQASSGIGGNLGNITGLTTSGLSTTNFTLGAGMAQNFISSPSSMLNGSIMGQVNPLTGALMSKASSLFGMASLNISNIQGLLNNPVGGLLSSGMNIVRNAIPGNPFTLLKDALSTVKLDKITNLVGDVSSMRDSYEDMAAEATDGMTDKFSELQSSVTSGTGEYYNNASQVSQINMSQFSQKLSALSPATVQNGMLNQFNTDKTANMASMVQSQAKNALVGVIPNVFKGIVGDSVKKSFSGLSDFTPHELDFLHSNLVSAVKDDAVMIAAASSKKIAKLNSLNVNVSNVATQSVNQLKTTASFNS